MMNRKSVVSSLALLLTAMIWGMSFVAQSVGMQSIGPIAFNAIRFLLAGLFLMPFAIRRWRRSPLLSKGFKGFKGFKDFKGFDVNEASKGAAASTIGFQGGFMRKAIEAGALSGFFLAAGSLTQQYAIAALPVGKVGFLTALYVMLIPLFSLALGKKTRWIIWMCCIAAAGGMYLMCMGTGQFILQSGDLLGISAAALFALYIISIGFYANDFDVFFFSSLHIGFASLFCFIPMLIFESVSLASVVNAIVPICYAGIMSSGVGMTLEAFAQKNINPTAASLIMSLESVFSLLFGWIILGQRMSPIELAGCAIVFAAVIASQLPSSNEMHKGVFSKTSGLSDYSREGLELESSGLADSHEGVQGLMPTASGAGSGEAARR